jgi:hypothetical protein
VENVEETRAAKARVAEELRKQDLQQRQLRTLQL